MLRVSIRSIFVMKPLSFSCSEYKLHLPICLAAKYSHITDSDLWNLSRSDVCTSWSTLKRERIYPPCFFPLFVLTEMQKWGWIVLSNVCMGNTLWQHERSILDSWIFTRFPEAKNYLLALDCQPPDCYTRWNKEISVYQV